MAQRSLMRRPQRWATRAANLRPALWPVQWTVQQIVQWIAWRRDLAPQAARVQNRLASPHL